MTLNEKSLLDEYSYTHPVIVEESIERKAAAPVDDSTASSRIDEDQKEELIDITESVPEEEKHLVKPAGVGGAILGMLCGGPLLSALLGFGSAYAVRKKTGTGDAARALGELTISVQEKSSQIEEKNHYLERTKSSINNFCDDKNEKSVSFKTRAFVVSSWFAASKYTKDNQLIERGVEGTGKGIDYIGKSITKLRRRSTTDKEEATFVSTDEVQDSVAKDQEYTKLVNVTTN